MITTPRLGSVAIAVAVVGFLAAGSANATPSVTGDTLPFQFTSDHCDNGHGGIGGCGIANQPNGVGGTVLVTDLGGANLNLIYRLQTATSSSTVAFKPALDLTSLNTINQVTYCNITPSAKFTIPNNIGSKQNAGSLMMYGTGNFGFGLDGVGNGGSNPDGSSLIFDIAATGLDRQTPENSSMQYFAADIISGTTTKTGGIDVSNSGTPGHGNETGVPDPGSMLLLGASLIGLGAVRRMRR
jgi:hypothetical protein